MPRIWPIVLLILSFSSVTIAQTPAESRLSVVFADDVAEDDAVAFIRGARYELIRVVFEPVLLYGTTGDEPASSELVTLRSTEGVLGVYVQDLAEINEGAAERLEAAGMRYHLRVEFAPYVNEQQAREIVTCVDHFHVRSFQKKPREIVIQVDANQEESIVEQLEASDLVKYVVYLAVVE
jgi:hypothetical protein